MKKKLFKVTGFIIAITILGACATKNTAQNSADQAFQFLVPQMDKELQLQRQPAQDMRLHEQLKARLLSLRTMNPKKFEIYLFPKISSMAAKSKALEGEVVLGRPTVFEVSPLSVGACSYLLKQGGFKKYNPQSYFPKNFGEQKDKTCAIIEIRSRTLAKAPRQLLLNGDELVKRLYLDESFKVYGIETEYMLAEGSSLKQKTVGVRLPATAASTAGLSAFPIDMPVFSQIQNLENVKVADLFLTTNEAGEKNQLYTPFETRLDLTAQKQIVRLKKTFKQPNCSLKKLQYQDTFANPVQMFWCVGAAWPQVVENQQFVAVTQNLQ